MKNKIAVVTGASSGIGAVYADRLAKRGYDIILVARRADRLASLASKIAMAHGVKVEPLIADLEKEADLTRVEQVLASNPAVSLLVNNAGIARLTPFAGSSMQDAISQISLNITTLARLTHAALPAFKSRNEGAIINIASVLALHSMPVSAVYSGTKAFVLGFSRGLQQELVDTAVKVQVVLPAATVSELWDSAGVSLSAFPPEAVMSTENLVDAALSGFDQGEKITWPSVADVNIIERFESARSALFAASQTGKPAPRLLSEPYSQP